MRSASVAAVVLVGGLLGLPAVPASAQDLELVPGSTVPRVQLTGEHFQIDTDGVYFTAPTPAATLSRSGVAGTDLGRPLSVGDRIYLFFGDTVGAYRLRDRYVASRGIPPGSGDSIGILPNEDFSACRYIEDVVSQIQRGVGAPAGDMKGCPTLSVLLNPLRAQNEHVFKPLVIDGLEEGESTGTFRVPTAVIQHNDAVYVFATTKLQESEEGSFWLQSALAKSTQPATTWSDTNPPAFTRLKTVSSHAEIADAAKPPAIETEGGKFMGLAAVAMEVGRLADLRLTRSLPRELQASDVVFVWGRGWNTARSDLYLAAFARGNIEAGPSGWFYYAGNGAWTRSEQGAVGVLGVTDVSEQSVTWNEALGRFVLMRGATGRIVAQFSTTPWGPWSKPVTVIDNDDPWLARLVHRQGDNRIVDALVPIYNADGTVQVRDEERGVPYSPNVFDRSTVNEDGSVTLYYTLSTWNPYQVFLFSSTFRPVAVRR